MLGKRNRTAVEGFAGDETYVPATYRKQFYDENFLTWPYPFNIDDCFFQGKIDWVKTDSVQISIPATNRCEVFDISFVANTCYPYLPKNCRLLGSSEYENYELIRFQKFKMEDFTTDDWDDWNKGVDLKENIRLRESRIAEIKAQELVCVYKGILKDVCDKAGGRSWNVNQGWLAWDTSTTKWLQTDEPLSQWEGITVDGEGSVVGLMLASNRLTGVISDSIGRLISLTSVDMSNNGPFLYGCIPPTMEALTNLVDLNLGWNSLTGSIPSGLGNLVRLRTLNLSSNRISGEIPSSLGALTNLTHLDLSSNITIRGIIPESMASLLSLNTLNLSQTSISGEIPHWLSGLTNLTYLNLSQTSLRRPLPEALGTLQNLQTLDVSRLGIASPNTPIPSFIGALANLRFLNLSESRFHGLIPDSISSLQNLSHLNLESNAIHGSIPDWIGALTNLVDLRLSSNKLVGAIPPSIGTLTNLVHLHLASNKLSGEIPLALGNMVNLTHVGFAGNRFVGSIPISLIEMQCNNSAVLNYSATEETMSYDTAYLPDFGDPHDMDAFGFMFFKNKGILLPADIGHTINMRITRLCLPYCSLTGTLYYLLNCYQASRLRFY